MRSLITVRKSCGVFLLDATGRFGGGYRRLQVGATEREAANHAIGAIRCYSLHNPEGGDLVAPPVVMALVPAHLRTISGTLADADAEKK